MSGELITTFVATLLYKDAMSEGFTQIVTEFNDAFRNRPQLPYAFGRPYDDFAVFDIEGAHIVVAHGDTAAPGKPREKGDLAVVALALSAAIGAERALVPRFERLLRSIIGRIQRPFPADAVLWSTLDGNFDPDAFDALLTEVTRPGAVELADAAPVSDENPAERVTPVAADSDQEPPLEHLARPVHPEPRAPEQRAAEGARAKRPTNRFAPIEDVVQRLGDAAPGASAAAPEAAQDPAEVANTLPDVPVPMLAEAARIRRALYPEPEILLPQKAPTMERLTIYTLNTALILVAMPVGVAVLTYNVLGRESLTTTARSVALAGFGVAFAHTTSIGQVLLAFI